MIRNTFAALILLICTSSARAQFGNPYSLDGHVVAGGGGTASGGTYVVTGTAGQTEAGPPPPGMTSGALGLVGGFWPGLRLCPADFNEDGHVTVQDIFDFLAAWFARLPDADFNRDGVVSVQDIFDFLAAWFKGCA